MWLVVGLQAVCSGATSTLKCGYKACCGVATAYLYGLLARAAVCCLKAIVYKNLFFFYLHRHLLKTLAVVLARFFCSFFCSLFCSLKSSNQYSLNCTKVNCVSFRLSGKLVTMRSVVDATQRIPCALSNSTMRKVRVISPITWAVRHVGAPLLMMSSAYWLASWSTLSGRQRASTAGKSMSIIYPYCLAASNCADCHVEEGWLERLTKSADWGCGWVGEVAAELEIPR